MAGISRAMTSAKLSLEKSSAGRRARRSSATRRSHRLPVSSATPQSSSGRSPIEIAGHAQQRDGHPADVLVVAAGPCQFPLLRPDQCFIHGYSPPYSAARRRTAAAGSAAPNTALPATRTSAPASTHSGAVAASTPPSTSSRKCRPRVFPLCLEPAQLVQRRGHELLPAEAGLHAHHQHQIQLVQVRGQRLRRGAGLDGQADLAAQRLDGVDGLLDIVLAFQMEILQGGTRLDETARHTASGWLIIRCTS